MSWTSVISILFHKKRDKHNLEKKRCNKKPQEFGTLFKPTLDESYCDYGDWGPDSICTCDGGDLECEKSIDKCGCKYRSTSNNPVNYFQLLPQELIMHILCYANMESLPSIFRTCKQFQAQSYNDLVWKEVCHSMWRERYSSYIPHGPIKPNGRSWKWMARTLRVSFIEKFF